VSRKLKAAAAAKQKKNVHSPLVVCMGGAGLMPPWGRVAWCQHGRPLHDSLCLQLAIQVSINQQQCLVGSLGHASIVVERDILQLRALCSVL